MHGLEEKGYEVSIDYREGERLLGSSRRRWEYNVVIYLK
jgi:hypothetical protein